MGHVYVRDPRLKATCYWIIEFLARCVSSGDGEGEYYSFYQLGALNTVPCVRDLIYLVLLPWRALTSEDDL